MPAMLRDSSNRCFIYSGAAGRPNHNPRFADRQTLIASDPTAPDRRCLFPSVVR